MNRRPVSKRLRNTDGRRVRAGARAGIAFDHTLPHPTHTTQEMPVTIDRTDNRCDRDYPSSRAASAHPASRRLRTRVRAAILGTLLAGSLGTVAQAEDTEVYFGQIDRSVDLFPNVLFVLDTSGSMNWGDTGQTGTRLERMREALFRILDSTANVNVGLMRFNGRDGGGAVIYPLRAIDAAVCDGAVCEDISLMYRVSQETDDREESIEGVSYSGGPGRVDAPGLGNAIDVAVGLGKIIDGPVLELGSDSDVARLTGLRFQNVDIPQGARITAARLEFSADTDTSGSTLLRVQAEDVDDSAPFTNDDGELSDRARTTASVDWRPDAWTEANVYQSDELSSVLQEVVNRPGWCGGNDLTFLIEGLEGQRLARSYNRNPGEAPALRVTWDADSIPASGGCVTRQLVAQVERSDDDAEELLSNQSVRRTSDDLDLPETSGGRQIAGVRFASVAIPRGALIRSAALEFEVDKARSGNVSLRIGGDANDNPPPFTTRNGDLSGRRTTSASVRWDDLPERPMGDKVDSPDIRSIVQELVNRGDWNSLDPMVFLLRHESGGGTRSYVTYDGKPEAAPKLKVTFTQPSGSGVAPVASLTARTDLKQTITGISATGATPIVSSLYEAAAYYLGRPVHYGDARGSGDHRHRYHRVSVPESYAGGSVHTPDGCSANDPDDNNCTGERIDDNPVYVPPLAGTCQSSHIVILSDGAATSNSAVNLVKSLTGATTCENGNTDEACGTELVRWLHDNDHNATLGGNQNITTHTIDFNNSGEFLKQLADAGGGSNYTANSAEDLARVFETILGDVLAIDTTFVAPSASVNQFNRLTHSDEIYFSLFKPAETARWSGNLKRYRTEIGTSGSFDIVDQNGNLAVDETTGFFSTLSKSYWSDTVDGNQVEKGGAANEIRLTGADGSGSRRVYTYTGDTAAVPTAGIDLTDGAHALHENNSAITLEMLELDGLPYNDSEKAAYRALVLKWARGVDVLDDDENDVTDEVRQHMGDVIHSRPVILNYADGENVLLVGTNEGYLHAIDEDDGRELYAFVPQALLPNLDTFVRNNASDRHPYGLDGHISTWVDDRNDNHVIDADDTAMVFVGMRRGGNRYYAFDVSNRTSPKLKWIIRGGSDGTSGFEELGESWSRPIPTALYLNGVKRDVLVFAAGYDTNQDPDPADLTVERTEDSIGRGLFVVDARTGEKLWSVLGTTGGNRTFTDMKYSMPSNVRVIDVDFDGLADQFYVGDMGGQLWRFDVKPYHQSGSGDLLQGGVIARLSGTGRAGERRFFYEPDVAMVADRGERFLSISIGSGWRAHPLDTGVDDRFFSLRTDAVYGPPRGYGKPTAPGSSVYVPITPDDLTDITGEMAPTVGPYGWMLTFEQTGEKVLGESITINNELMFTSYRPDLDVAACSTAIGSGAVYVVDVRDGSAVIDQDKDDDIDLEDREQQLTLPGIPPNVAAFFTEAGVKKLAGTKEVGSGASNRAKRTFWVEHDNAQATIVAGGDGSDADAGDGTD